MHQESNQRSIITHLMSTDSGIVTSEKSQSYMYATYQPASLQDKPSVSSLSGRSLTNTQGEVKVWQGRPWWCPYAASRRSSCKFSKLKLLLIPLSSFFSSETETETDTETTSHETKTETETTPHSSSVFFLTFLAGMPCPLSTSTLSTLLFPFLAMSYFFLEFLLDPQHQDQTCTSFISFPGVSFF